MSQQKIIVFSGLGIHVWNQKGIQMVLNKIDEQIEAGEVDFEEQQTILREALRYPGIWDAGNVSKFIDVFHKICKKFSHVSERKMTLIGTWKLFEDLRTEQLFKKVTLTCEDEILRILNQNPQGQFATAGENHGGSRVSIIRG